MTRLCSVVQCDLPGVARYVRPEAGSTDLFLCDPHLHGVKAAALHGGAVGLGRWLTAYCPPPEQVHPDERDWHLPQGKAEAHRRAAYLTRGNAPHMDGAPFRIIGQVPAADGFVVVRFEDGMPAYVVALAEAFRVGVTAA